MNIHARNTRCSYENSELDQIVAGENIRDYSFQLFGGEYLEQRFHDDLDFWELVILEIMVNSDEDDFGASPEKIARREKLLGLRSEVLNAYLATFREGYLFGACADGSVIREAPASIELLKRYRLFTRGVCEAAKEVWPNVNLQALFDQP